jgi:ribosomal protein S27E
MTIHGDRAIPTPQPRPLFRMVTHKDCAKRGHGMLYNYVACTLCGEWLANTQRGKANHATSKLHRGDVTIIPEQYVTTVPPSDA